LLWLIASSLISSQASQCSPLIGKFIFFILLPAS
jgi:hypothetical protein